MKRWALGTIFIIISFISSSCSFIDNQLFSFTNPMEEEFSSASRIIFVNNKDNALRFTVADTRVIKQIGSIISHGKKLDGGPDIKADYTITFYLQNGRQYEFLYWMGASQNGREINLKDQDGVYYSISDNLDTYILNNTKMNLRPNDFVNLYSSCISEAISNIEAKEGDGIKVGVDINSDRRMYRYTMSYEEQRIISNISSDKYTISRWTEEGKYAYVVTFLTNIYNPNKAEIVVDVARESDQTRQTFLFRPVYENGKWSTNMVVSEPKS